MTETIDPGEVAALWAEAKNRYNRRDFPTYGGVAWRGLHPDDPRRLAAVLEAAELWRRHQAEQDRLDALDCHDWYAEVFADARAVASRLAHSLGRVRAVRQQPAQFGPIHQLQATPGWGPVRIPGQPGMRRHLINGRQVDKHDDFIAESAA